MGRELKSFIIKKTSTRHTRKSVMQEGETKKTITYIENKQQNAEESPFLSVIALNVNGLRSPIKRQISRLD